MKSLAKVAAGVMVAKGIGAVMNKRQHGQPGQVSRSQNGGGLLGGLLGDNTGGQGGSVSDQLGKVLSGRTAGSGRPYDGSKSAQGGLGGLLDSLGGRSGSGSGGGLGGLLGQLSGGSGSGSSSGSLGGLLGGLLGGGAAGAAAGSLAQKDSQPKNDASFGELFNDAVAKGGEPEIAPTPEQNAAAGLMLRAMIQAAKSDGTIDAAEKERLLGHLGDDVDAEEREFIREQMAAPVDAAALAREVPKGMEEQVYLMSLLAIDFDNEEEARYLRTLAEAMGLAEAQVNKIHSESGVTPLYK